MEQVRKYYKVKVLHNEPFHMKFTGEYEYDFEPGEELIVPDVVAEIMRQRWEGVFEILGEVTPEDILQATKEQPTEETQTTGRSKKKTE